MSHIASSMQGVSFLCSVLSRRLSAEHEDPIALQEALLEEEKGSGPFAWIANKIPMALHNNKIWRTIFWVRCL
jgi:hypothetical protein